MAENQRTDNGSVLDLDAIPDEKDFPKWFTENYPGIEIDITKDIHAAFFYKQFKGKLDKLTTPDAIRRANAVSLSNSAIHTVTVASAVERASVLTLWTLKKENAYAFVDPNAEYESMKEWLAAKFSNMDYTDGAYSEIRFLLERFLPWIDEIGEVPEELLTIPFKYTKMRRVTSTLRQGFNEFMSKIDTYNALKEKRIQQANAGDVPEKDRKGIIKQVEEEYTEYETEAIEEFTEHMEVCFEIVASDDTVSEAEDKIKKLRYDIDTIPEKIPADEFVLDKNRSVIVIQCHNRFYSDQVKKKLKNIISEWRGGSEYELLELVSKGMVDNS